MREEFSRLCTIYTRYAEVVFRQRKVTQCCQLHAHYSNKILNSNSNNKIFIQCMSRALKTNTSSWVIHISWKLCCLARLLIILASACANPALFNSSRFVVGSSSARIPQFRQNVSARARRMTMHARTLWPAEQRPRISMGESPRP